MSTSPLHVARNCPKTLSSRQERMVATRKAKPKAASHPTTQQELQKFKEARASKLLARTTQSPQQSSSSTAMGVVPDTLHTAMLNDANLSATTSSRARSRSHILSAPASYTFQPTTKTRRRLSTLGSASEETDSMCDSLDQLVTNLTGAETSIDEVDVSPKSEVIGTHFRTKTSRESGVEQIAAAPSQERKEASALPPNPTALYNGVRSQTSELSTPEYFPFFGEKVKVREQTTQDTSLEHHHCVVEGYRPNVVVVVVNEEGKILCGERSDFVEESFWQCPQGGIDPGENVLEAALREAHEELGLDPNLLRALPPNYQCSKKFRYEFAKPVKKDGKYYKGQEQQVIIFMLNGGLEDCDLDSCPIKEFKRIEWKSLSELVPTVLPSKKQVYEAFQSLLPPALQACTAQEEMWI